MLPGAEVSLKNTGTGDVRTATTNTEGGFVVTDLVYGIYDVSVKKANFKEYISQGVEVHSASIYTVSEDPLLRVRFSKKGEA